MNTQELAKIVSVTLTPEQAEILASGENQPGQPSFSFCSPSRSERTHAFCAAGKRAGAASASKPGGTAQAGTRGNSPSQGGMARTKKVSLSHGEGPEWTR